MGLPDPLEESSRKTSDEAPGSAGAAVHYRRPFNCPSGLAAGGTVAAGRIPVELVVEGWSGTLVARLDDEPLGGPLPSSAAPLRISVTDRLHGHHQLEIDLTPAEPEDSVELTSDSACRLTGIVYLEIHD